MSTYIISHSSENNCIGCVFAGRWDSDEANSPTPIICRGQENAVVNFMILATF